MRPAPSGGKAKGPVVLFFLGAPVGPFSSPFWLGRVPLLKLGFHEWIKKEGTNGVVYPREWTFSLGLHGIALLTF